mmetsp:Transcript_49867/g.161068  ORF Transcript_49867/g.161068 Transcript_49867/m.161068 type:complete len:255 (+) Transcript_49867:85-849(+)
MVAVDVAFLSRVREAGSRSLVRGARAVGRARGALPRRAPPRDAPERNLRALLRQAKRPQPGARGLVLLCAGLQRPVVRPRHDARSPQQGGRGPQARRALFASGLSQQTEGSRGRLQCTAGRSGCYRPAASRGRACELGVEPVPAAQRDGARALQERAQHVGPRPRGAALEGSRRPFPARPGDRADCPISRLPVRARPRQGSVCGRVRAAGGCGLPVALRVPRPVSDRAWPRARTALSSAAAVAARGVSVLPGAP